MVGLEEGPLLVKESLGRCDGNRTFVEGAAFLDGREGVGERTAAGDFLQRPLVGRISDVETVDEAYELPCLGLVVRTDLAVDERGDPRMTRLVDVVAVWLVFGDDDVFEGLQ